MTHCTDVDNDQLKPYTAIEEQIIKQDHNH